MAGFIFRNERLSETARRAFRPPSSAAARAYLCYGNGFLKCTREREGEGGEVRGQAAATQFTLGRLEDPVRGCESAQYQWNLAYIIWLSRGHS